ncbi:MAG: hypothetical protein E8D52_08110 [Nitrospira sp.]|nr:MAG: hypothetical protein E8D52_08110 [Nitrospira sp.]
MLIQKLVRVWKMKTLLPVIAIGLALLCYAASAYAQVVAKCWTMVGSDGTVDQADLSIVALSSNTAAVRSGVSKGTVDIRYNVVAMDGVFGGDRNTKTLAVRLADNGPDAQVIVRLQQLNISTGVITLLEELNSNDFDPQTTAQRRAILFNCDKPDFDFANNVYYVEAQLIKTGPSGTPLIRAIQICNNGVC